MDISKSEILKDPARFLMFSVPDVETPKRGFRGRLRKLCQALSQDLVTALAEPTNQKHTQAWDDG